MHRDSLLGHFSDGDERFEGSVSPPVFRSSLFTFPDCGSLERAYRGEPGRDLYSRVSNPTVGALEAALARLEGGDAARAFSSGMGAISAVLLSLLRSGDHLVCFARSYGPTLQLVSRLLEPLGVRVTLLPPAEVPLLDRHIEERTRLIYLESPATFTFDVVDIDAVVRTGRDRGVPVAVDNSWATPLFHQPLVHGAALSIHSGTKYIAGHSDLVLGVVVGKEPWIGRVLALAPLLGASLSPDDAFLASRGLRTLSLRMARHERSGLDLARRLLATDRVLDVLHPALPFFATHGLWKRFFSGASGLFSFRLDGDPRRFCDALELFGRGVSWGGFESLALPYDVVAGALGADDPRPDIPRDTIRLSVGLEDPDDLWADLGRGFAASR